MAQPPVAVPSATPPIVQPETTRPAPREPSATELDELNTAVCETPNDPPSPTVTWPRKNWPVSPVQPVASPSARSTTVGEKRKATSPTDRPAKAERPAPVVAPPEESEWTVTVNGLNKQLHQCMQGDTTDPTQLRGSHLNTDWRSLEDGSKYELHDKMFGTHDTVVVTHQRDKTYRQVILPAKLDNKNIHKMIRVVCGPDYGAVVRTLLRRQHLLPLLRESSGSPK
ncbi:uncharacterized protein LOC121381320 [Gigantopelta aegis]|uniref:uncharacterized protein LOC121381320 n=1 Tax=Gigantopelta aegis TaxID=1735272 RepID=UPI001B8883DC|nr:uncharacterized protein LOC121381320 [Gigantopelta aegis]